MADERYSTKRLLALRKLTRAVAELLRGHLKDYLATMTILLRPRNVLGEFAEGPKEPVRGADAAFKELQTAYEALATTRPFNLSKELKRPLEVASSVPELTPFEYTHEAGTDRDKKTVTMTAPLKWILTYTGFGPKRLKELLAGQTTGNEIQEFVLHTLLLRLVLTRQPGLTRILEGLHFITTTARLPGCGELPFTFLTSTVPTVRPPDEVVIESTEISGTDAFEEVVSLDELAALRDPFREWLSEQAKQLGVELTIP